MFLLADVREFESSDRESSVARNTERIWCSRGRTRDFFVFFAFCGHTHNRKHVGPVTFPNSGISLYRPRTNTAHWIENILFTLDPQKNRVENLLSRKETAFGFVLVLDLRGKDNRAVSGPNLGFWLKSFQTPLIG